MKKLFKNKLIFFTLVSLSATTLSCTNNSEKINFQKIGDQKNKFISDNKFIQQIIDFQFENITQKKEFIYNQSKIIYNKKQELKSALVWFNPLRPYLINTQSDYRNLVETSYKILEKNITQNWLWILDNIQDFQFVFNPYGSKFDDENDNYFENIIRSVDQFNPSLSISIKNKDVIDLLQIELEKDDYDKFENKVANYLIYDSNKAIKILTYTYQNNKFVTLIPDLFYSPDTENINEFKNKLINLEKENNLSKNILINNDIEYNEYFGEEYDSTKSYYKFNDLNQYKNFSYTYSDIQKTTLKRLLTEEKFKKNRIYRYTWKAINE
ncbi:aromatic motif membrane protein [Mycoplasma anserisalpingitidis]|uniref:aromatic motif membrane protein n=1 Tax=Mycoplasma anserisalpingitidis TaxID=519450 RepID=UPI0011B0FDB9|nr:aromatic motif membrane protein [Mycoplasma anserisalpingitidis]QDY87957.1 hypothetical protein FOY45_03480 [Mycoplasma anserisalpingitidis]